MASELKMTNGDGNIITVVPPSGAVATVTIGAGSVTDPQTATNTAAITNKADKNGSASEDFAAKDLTSNSITSKKVIEADETVADISALNALTGKPAGYKVYVTSKDKVYIIPASGNGSDAVSKTTSKNMNICVEESSVGINTTSTTVAVFFDIVAELVTSVDNSIIFLQFGGGSIYSARTAAGALGVKLQFFRSTNGGAYAAIGTKVSAVYYGNSGNGQNETGGGLERTGIDTVTTAGTTVQYRIGVYAVNSDATAYANSYANETYMKAEELV